MTMHTDSSLIAQSQSLIGTWRRFGATGPVYEIVGLGHAVSQTHAFMRVKVIETGEEIDYPFTDILADPAER